MLKPYLEDNLWVAKNPSNPSRVKDVFMKVFIIITLVRADREPQRVLGLAHQ